jgi:hypothetical protein
MVLGWMPQGQSLDLPEPLNLASCWTSIGLLIWSTEYSAHQYAAGIPLHIFVSGCFSCSGTGGTHLVLCTETSSLV